LKEALLSGPLELLAAIGAAVAASEWLARHTVLRHLGSALLVIVIMAIAANARLVPTVTGDVPLYDAIFGYVAPMAIFLLLLQVNLAGIVQAGGLMLSLFLLGAAGTVAGVLIGMAAVGGSEVFGEMHFALGGMFVGTYTGGSINFNAIAIEYDVAEHAPTLYVGAAAVDSAMTTVWMAACVVLPRLLKKKSAVVSVAEVTVGDDAAPDTETVSPQDIGLLLALAAGSTWASTLVADQIGVPMVLVLTTVALALAQVPLIQRLRGARVCGWLAVLVFLAVIGALCDISALIKLESLAWPLTIFVVVAVLVHGAITFGVGAVLRIDPSMTAVASQANIGGSTSALALARSLDRGDLVVPAILIGSLGNALGTYLGFWIAAWLR
jgi:uncharacterized membrane protein